MPESRPSSRSSSRRNARRPDTASARSDHSRTAAPALPIVWSAGLVLPFALLAVARTVAAWFPDERLWGINHLAYLPVWATYAGLLLSLALCTPTAGRAIDLLGRGLYPPDDRGTLRRGVLLALLSAVLFWVARMETAFLGDGAVYLAEHYRFVRDLPYVADVLYSRGSAPVTGWLFAMAASAAHAFQPAADSVFAHPQFAFHLLTGVAGVLYVLVTWRGARRLSGTAAGRAAAWLLLVSVPGTLFFFGYVEYYTFAFVALTAYFLALDDAARGGRGLGQAALLLALAVSFHFLSIVALPAFLLVVAGRSTHPRIASLAAPRAVGIAVAVILAMGAVIYFATGIHTDGSRVVLSLYPFGSEGRVQSYTLLSSMHLLDILNYLALLAAPSAMILVMVWRREAFRRLPVLAAAVNVLFLVFLAVFGNMGFGIARDWDIVAVLGSAAAVLATVLVRDRTLDRTPGAAPDRDTNDAPGSLRDGERDGVRVRSILMYASLAMFAANAPWIAVNVHAPSSVARYKAVLDLDDGHLAGDYALNGYEHLRKYYFSVNDAAGTAWAIRKKIECVGYPDDFRKLAVTLLGSLPTAGRRAGLDWMADDIARRIERMNRDGVDSLYAGTKDEFVELAAETVLLAATLTGRDGIDAAYVDAMLSCFDALSPGHPAMRIARAQIAWSRAGGTADPAPFLDAAPGVRYSSSLCLYAGRALVNAKRWSEARQVLQRAMTLDPAFTLPLLYLAVAEYQESAAAAPSAIAHLERFLADAAGRRIADPAENARLEQYARGLLDHLRSLPR